MGPPCTSLHSIVSQSITCTERFFFNSNNQRLSFFSLKKPNRLVKVELFELKTRKVELDVKDEEQSSEQIEAYFDDDPGSGGQEYRLHATFNEINLLCYQDEASFLNFLDLAIQNTPFIFLNTVTFIIQ